MTLRERLDHGPPLVGDGAMGTMLYQKGAFLNTCFEELNCSRPEWIQQVHHAYIEAGCDFIETNTFGANRARLSAFGFGDKLKVINQTGVRLAREAAEDQAFVAGAVGPLGVRIEPLGPTSFAEARALFREQIEGLVTGLEQELAGMKERFGDAMIYKNPQQLAELQQSYDAKTAELDLLYRAYEHRAR